MNKEQEDRIRSLLDSWNSHTKLEAANAPAAMSADLVEVLGKIVNTYAYGHDEIQVLLKQAFTNAIFKARTFGIQQGRELEREANPAIRSTGACVKVARDAERLALRTTLRTVFDAETERGTNALYAFNEALKAIE